MTAIDLDLLNAHPDYPTGNFLRPNGHGGYVIRQSDISSWSRCNLQKYYEDRGRVDPTAPQREALSATEFGTVMHAALQQYELDMHGGTDPDKALDRAIGFFEHYWQPQNIGVLATPVTEWLPRQTYGGLRERGRLLLREYHQLVMAERDSVWNLALEYQFAIPVEIRGRLHTFTGTIDKLEIRKTKSPVRPYLNVADFKTGKRPSYLRWNTQGSGYGWATTSPQFWLGWPESGVGELESFDSEVIGTLEERFASWGYALHSGTHRELPLASRRFTWIDLKDVKFVDGGWRNQRDYARFQLAMDAYIRSCEAEVYSVNTDGEICRYCAFRKTCGGIGLPDIEDGAPK